MEAKDTVMSLDELLGSYYDKASPLDDVLFIEGLKEVALDQAEISFKAGIRELASELIEVTGESGIHYWMIANSVLRAKLKEWGLNNG